MIHDDAASVVKIPSTNSQAPQKLQIPTSNAVSQSEIWRSKLGASLELGAWNLRLDAVNLRTNFMAKTIELKLKEGDVAPAFTMATSGGGKISLADYKGQNVILYFYPKDDTPGCTKEACSFRDHFADFKKADAVILGVSPDAVKSHDKFVEKFKLPFTLLADEDKKIVQAYGVWGEKSFMGRKYLGVFRVTFLIGPTGKIKKIWPEVKPEEHAAEVLAALK
jgi:thioredoxin-dependent peroxiredoxin